MLKLGRASITGG